MFYKLDSAQHWHKPELPELNVSTWFQLGLGKHCRKHSYMAIMFVTRFFTTVQFCFLSWYFCTVSSGRAYCQYNLVLDNANEATSSHSEVHLSMKD